MIEFTELFNSSFHSDLDGGFSKSSKTEGDQICLEGPMEVTGNAAIIGKV